MALNEFEIIQQYFSRLTRCREDVAVGIGDDCALLIPEPGKLLAVSTDTLVAGHHFLSDVNPESLGHKSLAVNLSDLAAMGAQPCWISLALTLPQFNEKWLERFAAGFARLADQYSLQLVGGDLTRGPLSISITVHGQVETKKALRRSGAGAGDIVCVSGKFGEAASALGKIINNEPVAEPLRQALEWPQPRVELGLALAGLATACIDVSDGLISDLGHICTASCCKAVISQDLIPVGSAKLSQKEFIETALTGGDDYELCFTLPADQLAKLEDIALQTGVAITPIGKISEGQGVEVVDASGIALGISKNTGYMHFHD